ncbi:hypothetical protein M3204_15580 [Mesobacillus subterraneus]|uniref:hypothetical protein n=1 Tax=Mesobacillus subterraneus TaxID=285983 RepID=UPI00204044C6|nr:hypothetical protein [Mesobacillus subterraneus]MCM3665839.1 hypothetical protein [Mesobacillus subterraneus]MCM3684770.1 hypothetical protein [Mesobacillus subterraneus]
MTIKMFAEILKYPYVIVYDTATGNKLHKTNCSYITKKNFDLKVIINQEKNGYYHPLAHLEELNDPSVQPCKVCKPKLG